MAHQDQTVKATTPNDAITRMVRLPKVGMMVVGDSQQFKAGEVIVLVNALPAFEAASWDAWLKSDTGIFTVLDAQTHRPTTRTIPRL